MKYHLVTGFIANILHRVYYTPALPHKKSDFLKRLDIQNTLSNGKSKTNSFTLYFFLSFAHRP